MIPHRRRTWYLEQLRTLATATRWLSRPDEMALRIHQHIAKREGELVRALIAGRFESEGASAAGKWKPLALRTAIERKELGFGEWNPILRRSGFLLRAAVGGRIDAYPDRLEIVFKDGPAPVYTGKGKSRKARRKHFVEENGGWRKVARKAFDLWQGPRAVAGLLSEYAADLNEERPFYGKPTPDEQQPVRARGREILTEVIRRIAAGQAPGI